MHRTVAGSIPWSGHREKATKRCLSLPSSLKASPHVSINKIIIIQLLGTRVNGFLYEHSFHLSRINTPVTDDHKAVSAYQFSASCQLFGNCQTMLRTDVPFCTPAHHSGELQLFHALISTC